MKSSHNAVSSVVENIGSMEIISRIISYLIPTVTENEKNLARKFLPLYPPFARNNTIRPSAMNTKYPHMNIKLEIVNCSPAEFIQPSTKFSESNIMMA
jgi:hypothetical protein